MVLAPRAQKTQFFIEYFDIFESSFQKTQFFIEFFDILDFQPSLRPLRALRSGSDWAERGQFQIAGKAGLAWLSQAGLL